MNPYFDETLVLILSASLEEAARSLTDIRAMRESSSHTFMEGVCHEVCYASEMSGPASGIIFLGLDRYSHSMAQSKLRELASSLNVPAADSASIQLFQEVLELTRADLGTAYPALKFSEPRIEHNKLIPLPRDDYRKYRMIFFLRDSETETYLGRFYLLVALQK